MISHEAELIERSRAEGAAAERERPRGLWGERGGHVSVTAALAEDL